VAGLYSGNPASVYGSDIWKGINDCRKKMARKLISFKIDSILLDVQSLPALPNFLGGGLRWPLRFFVKTAAVLDVHKTWIYACIRITDANGRTEYKKARFSSFMNGLQG